MAALSVTTIVLSLTDGCPGPAFYILEVIINTSMILEVSIRLVALGRVGQYSLDKAARDANAHVHIAILAITFQRGRPHSDHLLCVDIACSGVCEVRRRK